MEEEELKDFVEFKSQTIDLPGYIRFSITRTVFEKLNYQPKGAIDMLRELSSSQILLITKTQGQDLYDVFTKDGTYKCRITDNWDSLLVIAFNSNDLISQNRAMKDGICFKINKGIIIQLKIQEPYNHFFDIVNGKKLRKNRYENKRVKASLEVIKKHIELAKTSQEDYQDLEEDHQVDRRLSTLLEEAENYSILASELEENKANEIGRISYFKLEAIDYHRVDRVAYKFVVDDLDENTFKVGSRLKVEDKQGQLHYGEIINIDLEEDDSIDLLFNKQIDIKDFAQIGWIGLSFSSVNKEVQLDAIHKIRRGEAASKYMDKVLGQGSSQGFEDKDLKEIKQELMKGQYPPNPSQMKAISAGINTKDVFLVMGPPGTGKTTVILEWAKYFIEKEHKRVLISSQNNKAVDNVLSRIADEKKIDMIRIGSESKLQEEVKPYMFENKLRSLRESIVKNTSANMEKIQDLLPAWTSFLEKMEALILITSQVESLKDYAGKKIDDEIIGKYKKLLSTYEDYNNLRVQIVDLEEKLKLRIGKIEKYKERVKTFRKLIFWPVNFFRNILNKRDVKKYDSFKKEEKKLAEEYNNLYPQYSLNYEKIMKEEFTDYYYKSLDRDQAIDYTSSIMPQASNKWKLFANIVLDEEAWKTSEFLRDMERKIKEEKIRSESIVDLLESWKKETESSQNYALNEIVLESVDLVGATCIGINSQRRFADLDFDVTIIDEAGQIQVHNALVPMSVSNKLIMLGDHKQIPPTRDEELLSLCQENGVDSELLEISLFEMIYDEIPEENKMMLDTQYRMPGEIADTISEWFYEGEYLSADFKRNMASEIPRLSKKPFVIIDTSKERNRYEKKLYQAGSENALEASIVSDLLYSLSLDSDIDLEEIGIISAYKAQVKLIKKKLRKLFAEDVIKEMVATLDSFQGQERDIIIYSFTKSSSRDPRSRRIGFLNELRRLNVAMTRCKKMLILIGDMDFLSSCKYMEEDEYEDEIYEKSEKEFSDFINKMIMDVEAGRGEFISYREFINRMEKGER